MKSLGETEADQLEDSIYEDSGEMDARFRGLTTKSDLRVRKSELESILRQLQYRAKNAAGFVQIVLSPHGKSATVLLACLLKDGLVWREESVEFIPGRHLLNDYDSWVDVVAEVDNFDYSNSDTGSLNSYAVSPLGQPSVRLLWKRTLEALSDINGGGTPEHLLFVSDSALASIPWQLVAMENPDDQGVYPIVTMVHGLRWLYLSAHIPEEVPKYERFHDRGIQVWIADTPTPREDLAIRDQVKAAFFDAQADSPSLTDVPGVSLSVVFGHGAMLDGSPMPANEAVRRPQDWHDVRDSRICVLLSCYTGAGTPGALGDYLSISHKLCRTSKALIAPPVKVPYTAALAIAEVFHQAMRASVEGAT
ncbi:MAG: hypothetical protein AB2692_22835, partial [Candidatus Thiodiazotropha sp.]